MPETLFQQEPEETIVEIKPYEGFEQLLRCVRDYLQHSSEPLVTFRVDLPPPPRTELWPANSAACATCEPAPSPAEKLPRQKPRQQSLPSESAKNRQRLLISSSLTTCTPDLQALATGIKKGLLDQTTAAPLADKLSTGLATSWHAPDLRRDVRRCLYSLRLTAASNGAERELYRILCSESALKKDCCRKMYAAQLEIFLLGPAAPSVLKAGELLYELCVLRDWRPDEHKQRLAICTSALALCTEFVGPFRSTEEPMQNLFGSRANDRYGSWCMWVYSLALTLARQWKVEVEATRPEDPRCLNSPAGRVTDGVSEHDLITRWAEGIRENKHRTTLSDYQACLRSWPPALDNLRVSVELIAQETRRSFFFCGPGLQNPHVRRLLPRAPRLLFSAQTVIERDPQTAAPTSGEVEFECKEWALQPMQLELVGDRLGYVAAMPGNDEDLNKFRSVLARWCGPITQLIKQAAPAAVCHRAPPYKYQEPRPFPSLLAHGWQIGWDKEFEPTRAKDEQRHLLMLRGLLVGALCLIDARLNPMVQVCDYETWRNYRYFFYNQQGFCGASTLTVSTAVARLLTAMALLHELEPSFTFVRRLCPVVLELDSDVKSVYCVGGHNISEREARQLSAGADIFLCGMLDHLFVLYKGKAGGLVLCDSNANTVLNCAAVAKLQEKLRTVSGLSSVLGFTASTLEFQVRMKSSLARVQPSEGSCTAHAVLIAARLAIAGRVPNCDYYGDAWLLLGSALALRFLAEPYERRRILYLRYQAN